MTKPRKLRPKTVQRRTVVRRAKETGRKVAQNLADDRDARERKRQLGIP